MGNAIYPSFDMNKSASDKKNNNNNNQVLQDTSS
jgi:hypothetical protein